VLPFLRTTAVTQAVVRWGCPLSRSDVYKRLDRVTSTFMRAAPHRGCVCLRTDGAVALCFNHKADTGSVRRKRARVAHTRKASHAMIYVTISRDVDDTRGPEAVPGITAMISTSGS
jgi:hypothetical protein